MSNPRSDVWIHQLSSELCLDATGRDILARALQQYTETNPASAGLQATLPALPYSLSREETGPATSPGSAAQHALQARGNTARASVPLAPHHGLSGLPARYDVGPLLGSGGMGQVFRAHDHQLERPVALKVLHTFMASQEDLLERFFAEAQITAQLQHPGIVPVYDVGRLDDGRYWFTMREVHGQTLKALLKTQSQEVHAAPSPERWGTTKDGWTFRRLLDAFHKVCETVAYAHARGVMHRDLTPANVMIGSFGEVLVLDWGLARPLATVDPIPAQGEVGINLTRRRNRVRATQPGQITGTPAYMPPEQARGELDRLGPSADVYALGAMLYEILDGSPPYCGGAYEVIGKLVQGIRPPPPGAGRDGEQPPIPPLLTEICSRAMALEPADRCSGSSLAKAIADWLDGTQRHELALAHVAEADALVERIQLARNSSIQLRLDAKRLLESMPMWAPVECKCDAWQLEDQAEVQTHTADQLEIDYVQQLNGALTLEADLPEAHERLAAYHRRMHAEAEAGQLPKAAMQEETLLRQHDTRGQYAAYLKGDGALTLVTDPAGADVDLFRFETVNRRLEPQFVRRLGRTPLLSVPLAMGSYLLVIRAPGRQDVRYPVNIDRNQEWTGVRPGDVEPFPIYLPREGELGPEDCYMPAGWFLSGGDVGELSSLPERWLWVDARVMKRFPVRNVEYVAFLNHVLIHCGEEAALRLAPRERAGRFWDTGAIVVNRDKDGLFCLGADEDGDVWLPDEPVTLVDCSCCVAYSQWFAEREGQPWRLPLELEWEKAARGVDGRIYPWGDLAERTWACIRFSTPGRAQPTPVDQYPLDRSVYGVRGMAGNVRDLCQDPFRLVGPPTQAGGRVPEPLSVLHSSAHEWVIRGGAWSLDPRYSRVTNRDPGSLKGRFAFVGFRLIRNMSDG